MNTGINPGNCGVCGSELVVSNRIPFAKCPEMPSNVFSFDCPKDPEHIEATDLKVYYIYRN
ncbi:MAG TPA: hypothetical protein VNV43_02680 [Candidatus Acidoferrales bacterium]|nr:hypothetical protein [Candidatus Acidoferrales bacterium]